MLICAILASSGLVATLAAGTPWAFALEIERRRKQRALYLKKHTSNIEEEYLSLDADIHHRSNKKHARSIRQGIENEFCPTCGDIRESNEAFCTKCGTKLDNKCAKCGRINNPSDKFCKGCGEKLYDSKNKI